MAFPRRIENFILKFIQHFKASEQPNNLDKKVGGLTLCDFKTYYKAIELKTVGYWPQNRHIDEWNADPWNKSHIRDQTIFDKC